MLLLFSLWKSHNQLSTTSPGFIMSVQSLTLLSANLGREKRNSLWPPSPSGNPFTILEKEIYKFTELGLPVGFAFASASYKYMYLQWKCGMLVALWPLGKSPALTYILHLFPDSPPPPQKKNPPFLFFVRVRGEPGNEDTSLYTALSTGRKWCSPVKCT